MRAPLLFWLPFAIALATDASAQFTASFPFDGADLSPGDGVCNVAGHPAGVAQCTLRAAIQEINVAGTGMVTLQGASFAVTLGEIEVTGQALVLGYSPAVQAIDAGGASRIFSVPAGGVLTLQRVALANGSASELGGAIYGSGGNVALLECAVEGSVAAAGGAIAMVGGGTLGIVSSLLRNNEARATVDGSSISGGSGGAIYAVHGPQLVVASSTLTGNVADTEGGAVALGPDVRLRLVNSTVSGNRAEGISFAPGRGGGIHIGVLASGDLRSSTLTSNFATKGGGVALASRDLTLSLENTIVAGNERAGPAWRTAPARACRSPRSATTCSAKSRPHVSLPRAPAISSVSRRCSSRSQTAADSRPPTPPPPRARPSTLASLPAAPGTPTATPARRTFRSRSISAESRASSTAMEISSRAATSAPSSTRRNPPPRVRRRRCFSSASRGGARTDVRHRHIARSTRRAPPG